MRYLNLIAELGAFILGYTKIGVIGGCGHIGLIQAACLAKLNHKVIAYDIDKNKIEGIKKGTLPFKEDGLEEVVLETVNNGLLSFTMEMRDLQDAEIVFICVGTPSLSNGEADLSQIYSSVEALAQKVRTPCLAVIKSTVPAGTSRRLTAYLEERKLSKHITMVSNPEFLKEGTGVKDFWEPARIVVGSQNEENSKKIADLYKPKDVPVVLTSWENAELIKLVSNAFLSSKISFINEISLLCEKVGADVRIISRGIGLDPRINLHFIEAGVGFSGPCLEKDLKSLIKQYEEAHINARILKSVLDVNEGQRQAIVEKLEAQLGTLQGKDIAVFGMAFKQETDDVRQSHNLPIVKNLISKGAKVTATDPWVKSTEQAGLSQEELPGVEWIASPYDAAEAKDAVLILTAWKEYRELDIQRLKQSLRNPLIVDGRNLFNVEEMKKFGINYIGVGI
ncbi:MAG: nucleotide sugar dehydrogenase [Clostridia bacterium]|nr:nucleotide sugar dehydrogenase [Clostridia bacterium]